MHKSYCLCGNRTINMASRETERYREREITKVYFRKCTRRKEWMRKTFRKFCKVNFKKSKFVYFEE